MGVLAVQEELVHSKLFLWGTVPAGYCSELLAGSLVGRSLNLIAPALPVASEERGLDRGPTASYPPQDIQLLLRRHLRLKLVCCLRSALPARMQRKHTYRHTAWKNHLNSMV